jgi:TonB family protein
MLESATMPRLSSPGVLVGALAGAVVLAAPGRAAAFCGFYVAGADSKLYNNATVVVMMRAGTRTALAMQNNYEGPPEGFAMVVPVPVVLKKADVKTLPRELFARLDALTAPRLVEYWERDPCDPALIAGGMAGGAGTGAGFGGRGPPAGPPVRVEAQFAVGEYDIVILGADDAVALEGWLTDHKYVIPAGAAEHLRPYVASGSKFFVAKVDPSKVVFKDGQAMLSPLRVVYPSEDFRLPIRLGLINAKGPQDLIVNILAEERQEVANYPNVMLPTEIVVKEEVRDQFPAFYTALFDGLLARSPKSVVTEYAWDARGCDPCPEEPLTSQELASLGMDALYDGVESLGPPDVRIDLPTVVGPIDRNIVRRITRAHINEFRYCFNQVIAANQSNGGGAARIDFTIDAAGRPKDVTYVSGPTAQRVDQCLVQAVKRWSFPKPATPATVQLPFALTRDGSGRGQRSFVLTRLHARYDATTLGEDLIFRAAPPIANGSGGAQGPFTQTPMPAGINRFQGRYIVRHAWKGPITCQAPVREVWGGPPEGGKEKVAAVKDAAFAPRGPQVAPEPAEAPRTGCGCRAEAPMHALWMWVVLPLVRRRRQVQARSQSVPR